MRLALPSLILFVYVMLSLVWPLPCRPQVKAAAGVLFLVVSLKYLFYEKVFGSFIAPNLPYWLMLGMEVLYASLVILCFLLIIKDVTAVILWLNRCLGASWHLPFSSGVRGGGIAVLALTLSLWGTWQAVRVPKVRTVEIRLPQMEPCLDGFSIIQLSDLHIGLLLKRDWLEKVVKQTNALTPDLVAVTGDMIDGYAEDLKDEVFPLEGLVANYGVFGISGNHEVYFREERWRAVFKSLGITMLHNDHRTIVGPGGAKLVIAGVPDPALRQIRAEGPDLRKALKNALRDAVRIMLEHRPGGGSGNEGIDLKLSWTSWSSMLDTKQSSFFDHRDPKMVAWLGNRTL